ncbi:MAG: hypothetical protein ACOY5U_10675 [Pseudomonadota bacterium]
MANAQMNGGKAPQPQQGGSGSRPQQAQQQGQSGRPEGDEAPQMGGVANLTDWASI